jgi:hypothetical protein
MVEDAAQHHSSPKKSHQVSAAMRQLASGMTPKQLLDCTQVMAKESAID